VNVIEEVLSIPWPPAVEAGRDVPQAHEQTDCVECYSWEYGDFAKKDALY